MIPGDCYVVVLDRSYCGFGTPAEASSMQATHFIMGAGCAANMYPCHGCGLPSCLMGAGQADISAGAASGSPLRVRALVSVAGHSP